MTTAIRQPDIAELHEWPKQTEDRVPVLLDVSSQEPIVAICHHAIRSAMVAEWFEHHDYTQVFNLEGGIDTWARIIDHNIGFY